MKADDFVVLQIPHDWLRENPLPEEFLRFMQHPVSPAERRRRFEVERELRKREEGFISPDRMKLVFGEHGCVDAGPIFL